MAKILGEPIFNSIIDPEPHLPAPGEAAQPRRLIASKTHTIIVLVLMMALSTWSYIRAQKLLALGENDHRVFTYLLSIAAEWAMVGYIAWGVKRSGGSLRNLIGGRWVSVERFFIDVGIAGVFWIVSLLILLGVTKGVLHAKDNSAVLKLLAPHTGLEMLLWIFVALTAGFCEEVIFRGYLQQQFIAWSNRVPVGIGLSVLFFGAGHIYQGIAPAIGITVFGLLFSLLAYYRKSLRPGMMAHAWQDALAGIALGLMDKLKRS